MAMLGGSWNCSHCWSDPCECGRSHEYETCKTKEQIEAEEFYNSEPEVEKRMKKWKEEIQNMENFHKQCAESRAKGRMICGELPKYDPPKKGR